MKKKISLFMLCGVILLGLCGCGNNEITNKNETNKKLDVKEDIDIKENDNDTNEDVNLDNKKEIKPTISNNTSTTNNKKQETTNNDKNEETHNKEEINNNITNNNSNNNTNEETHNKEESNNNIINNNSNNNTNEETHKDTDNKPPKPTQEEITITSSNLFEYFEIKREDIIPELNAFGERGTEEDFYYELLLSLKNKYKQKLVSTNVSVEFASETYLRSFSYNRQTGIGTITNEYRTLHNKSDKILCNIKNESSCYITTCHIAGSQYINDKLVYYAYITEKLDPIRVGGSIILKK